MAAGRWLPSGPNEAILGTVRTGVWSRDLLLTGAKWVWMAGLMGLSPTPARAQTYAERHAAALAYVNAHADFDEFIMIPMRDGTHLYASILFPRGTPRTQLPAVLFRTPYQIRLSSIPPFYEYDRFADYAQSFLSHGYAVAFENVRGRFFSEGTYHYLVGSGSDGYDTVEWITRQPWSNGKVGTLGCSSTAEEQHKLNAAHPPGLAAAIPMGSGAGIGRVGPYNEMGNFYRGGAVQLWWIGWYDALGHTYRPSFPPSLSREVLRRLGRFWTLDPIVPSSGLDTAISILPINAIPAAIHAPPTDVDDFINRLPNDPRWRAVDFGGEEDRYSVPTLLVNSWYDISIGPNTAMYEYQSRHAATASARDNMFMVVAPTPHCEEGQIETEHTMVGARDVGDARFDYVGLTQRWFDHFLRGIENGVTQEPKVRAYVMGANVWRSYDRWPPAQARPVSYYLDSDGDARSLQGNGRLTTAPPASSRRDTFVYDPLRPVPSLGGSMCCMGTYRPGAFDQSAIEMRADVLVYTTPPFARTVEVTGPVRTTLYLSSDRKDTDLAVKLLDVYPDGRAFNLDESIQRVRWRAGWDHPVFMDPGHIYRVEVGPLVTSNAFLPGHRLRIEVSSSNFPHFERNLNTGGNNYDERDPLIAHNTIYHDTAHPSAIVVPVIGPP